MPRPTSACRLVLAALALALAACDDSPDDSGSAAANGADLSAVKDFLLAHTGRLQTTPPGSGTPPSATTRWRRRATSTTPACSGEAAEVRAVVRAAQREFAHANPAYEQMEGIVTGVPSLAEYDGAAPSGSRATSTT
jgi:hypothetical protein